jgi:hypothetical protein
MKRREDGPMVVPKYPSSFSMPVIALTHRLNLYFAIDRMFSQPIDKLVSRWILPGQLCANAARATGDQSLDGVYVYPDKLNPGRCKTELIMV